MTADRRPLRLTVMAALLASSLALPTVALGHVERSGYWPDPAPDCTVKPCAGGKVPAVRSLASALVASRPGRTRVVCAPDSMARVRSSVASARAHGYDLRPTDHRTLGARAARKLLATNRRLHELCGYHEIQPAVLASHNNDRVVVMPGLYTEPTAAAKPTHDEACAQYRTHSDFGDAGALSYAYQVRCPNDANLISVTGRAVGPGKDPDPALVDRHGIPNIGPCVRCNLQLEGSGVSPDDVIVEAGDPKAGNGGPSAVGHRKDVGIFVDRADGFVLRNVTVRHAFEHGIYALETDGYRFDRFKAFYSGSYGVLTFVEDHGLMENCDAAGHGDSGLYPGAGAKTSAGRDTKYYPEFRYSQEIRNCDSHHNDGGYSGTDGNATHVDHNNFYDNALGFTTDVFTAPGHPGFPQQGDLIEDNNFYSNNFNPYAAGSDVKPSIAAPVGTGLWIAGGNDNVIRNNRFWDNRRRGTMLFSAPDATVCGPAIGSPVTGCDPAKTSTSYNNSFHGNVMGVAPDGTAKPNGTDFWWDSYPDNTGNCWFDNHGPSGRAVTTSPSPLPDCAGGKDPGQSIGTGSPQNEAELTACLAGFEVSGYPNGNQTICTWTLTPGAPASSRALIRPVPVPAGSGDTDWLATATITTTPLGQYRCSDWRTADAALRRGILQRLRRFTGGPVGSSTILGYGTVLPNDRATALFDVRCAEAGTGSYLLYRLYGPAAAFAGVAP